MYRHHVVLFALFGLTSMSQAGFESFFDQRIHDFGATPRGPTLVHYFRFTNSGKETLVISNVRVSCGCVTASAPVTHVKPGESSYITAQMDSRRFTGPKSVTVFVQFSSPRYEEVSMVVTANGRDDFSMFPESIAFGTVRRGGTPTASVQVTLVGDPNWDIKDVKAESNYVKPSAKLLKRNGAEVTFEISASLRNDLPVGKWFTDIYVTTTNPNLAKVRVPLHVEVGAPITATPVSLNLGDIKIGDNVEQNILIRGEKSFKIKSVQGVDQVVSITGMGDEAKLIHILKVTVKPQLTGEISRELTILTEENGDPVVVPLRAKGTKE
ncbi:MAG: DUF1573 domain-containing protein [Planctomycetes bacterium]|nr:DUF1573 domain-containing protein [Planctomycetota bacterium]